MSMQFKTHCWLVTEVTADASESSELIGVLQFLGNSYKVGLSTEYDLEKRVSGLPAGRPISR